MPRQQSRRRAAPSRDDGATRRCRSSRSMPSTIRCTPPSTSWCTLRAMPTEAGTSSPLPKSATLTTPVASKLLADGVARPCGSKAAAPMNAPAGIATAGLVVAVASCAARAVRTTWQVTCARAVRAAAGTNRREATPPPSTDHASHKNHPERRCTRPRRSVGRLGGRFGAHRRRCRSGRRCRSRGARRRR